MHDKPRSFAARIAWWVASVIPLTTLMMVLPIAGCATHAQHRVQAEQHWNQVRADVKLQLATQQFERGQIEAAIGTINESITVNPGVPEAAEQYLLLANCHLEQGKLASARRAVAEAQRCDPYRPEVEYTLGVIAERTDRLEDALDHFRNARYRDDTVVDYVVAEAECLTALGYPEEAMALVSENLGRFDSDGTLEMLLAQICLLIDDKETALRNLRLALERSGCGGAMLEGPSRCDQIVEEYGRLLSETGRYAEVVAVLRPYVEARNEVSPSLVTALCAGYLGTDRVEQADRLLREEVRRHPDNAQCWLLLARTSVLTGNWMSARRCVDRLGQLVPRSAQAHLLRGFVCWKQNDLPAAKDALQRAVYLDPDDTLAHYMIDQVLLATKTPRRHDSEGMSFRE